jgi:MFS family permease
MDLTRNVKGAISFVVIMMFLVVYDMIMEHSNESWTMDYPSFIHHSMGALEGVVIPAIFVLSGAALLYGVLADRRGYVGLLLLGILAIVWNIPAAIWRFEAGAPYGAAICLFGILTGLIIGRFALAALQESRSAAPMPSRVAA